MFKSHLINQTTESQLKINYMPMEHLIIVPRGNLAPQGEYKEYKVLQITLLSMINLWQNCQSCHRVFLLA